LRSPAGGAQHEPYGNHHGGWHNSGGRWRITSGLDSITKTWTGNRDPATGPHQGKGSASMTRCSKFRPDVPGGDHITIAELLKHAQRASFITTPEDARTQRRSATSNPQKVWNSDELLALAYSHPPYSPTRETGYHYSNTKQRYCSGFHRPGDA